MSLSQPSFSLRGRAHLGYVAFLVHRLSGIALALFLPLHFLVLGSALTGADGLNDFLAWAANPWVKLSEWLLVSALAVHMAGGIRVLALEFLPWSERQILWVTGSFAFAGVVGLMFLMAASYS